jgi:hypothetical protein
MQIFQRQDEQFGEKLSNGISFLVAMLFGLATIGAALHGMVI